MTEKVKKKIVKMIKEMSNGELLKFNMKFRKEKEFMSEEQIEFIQEIIDEHEKFLRKKARI